MLLYLFLSVDIKATSESDDYDDNNNSDDRNRAGIYRGFLIILGWALFLLAFFLLVLLAFLVLLWCKSRLILTLVADVSADLTKSSLTPIQLGKCLTPHKKGDEVLYGTLKCFIPHTHHISQRRYL